MLLFSQNVINFCDFIFSFAPGVNILLILVTSFDEENNKKKNRVDLH